MHTSGVQLQQPFRISLAGDASNVEVGSMHSAEDASWALGWVKLQAMLMHGVRLQ